MKTKNKRRKTQSSIKEVKRHIKQRKLKRRSVRLKSRYRLYSNGLFLGSCKTESVSHKIQYKTQEARKKTNTKSKESLFVYIFDILTVEIEEYERL